MGRWSSDAESDFTKHFWMFLEVSCGQLHPMIAVLSIGDCELLMLCLAQSGVLFRIRVTQRIGGRSAGVWRMKSNDAV